MASLKSLKVIKRCHFTDPNTNGLELRVTPQGGKTWAFRYVRKSDGKKRRVTIGKFGDQKGFLNSCRSSRTGSNTAC